MTVEDTEDGAGSFQALDEIYARYQEAEKIPGLAFGVVRNGSLAYAKGLGIVSVESKAPVGTGHLLPHRLDDQGDHRHRHPAAAGIAAA